MLIDQLSSKLENQKSYRIVFLGDSITSSEWVHPNWRDIVEYVLKEELAEKFNDWKLPSWNLRFINSGFDGASTQDLLEKYQSDVLAYKPDLVLMIATSNDIFSDISPEQHKLNIKQLIDKLIEANIQTVYCTDICSANELYDQKYKPYLAQALSLFPYKEIPHINMFDELKQYQLPKMFTFVSSGNAVVGIKPGDIDFIHPNQLGNAYIAKILLEKLFNINFDPEKYIQDNDAGKMFPEY